MGSMVGCRNRSKIWVMVTPDMVRRGWPIMMGMVREVAVVAMRLDLEVDDVV